ncbi:MAG: hypothetical protein JWR32_4079 [Mycobacterium sp.]|jgi:hypothetical protein|nr:hypothetical protein [Mycobacterium sp.]
MAVRAARSVLRWGHRVAPRRICAPWFRRPPPRGRGPTGTDNLVEIISGTRPMTVEQYTAATRTWYESDGQYASWASVGDHHTR